LAGSTIRGDRSDVAPPSTSFEPAVRPALTPVTNADRPDAVVDTCFVPFEAVPCGSPRCHMPWVAVSVSSAFTRHPLRPISRSSKKSPQLRRACAALTARYGQPACSMT
jgi:hypothetical protein